MKRILIIAIAISFYIKAHSQQDCCSKDLQYLSDFLIDNSLSFKETVQSKNAFITRKDSILNLIKNDPNSEIECRKYLSLLLLEIKDGHLKVNSTKLNLRDSIEKNKFIKSERISNRRRTSLNLDSIIQLPNTKQFYYYWSDIKILDFEKDNQRIGVVNGSDIKYYKKGDIFYTIQENNGRYQSVFYNYLNEPTSYYSYDLENAYIPFDLCRGSRDSCFYQLRRIKKLQLIEFDKNTLYISIDNFKNPTKKSQQEFENFLLKEVYPIYKGKRNVIFDLRNNSGGASGGYEKFLKKLKKDKTNINIYILQNRHTASAAELFILELKKIKTIKILGENSAGALSFRDIQEEMLPSKKYFLRYPKYIVNKSYKQYLLKYERIGIVPHIYLNNDLDWVKQTLEIIE